MEDIDFHPQLSNLSSKKILIDSNDLLLKSPLHKMIKKDKTLSNLTKENLFQNLNKTPSPPPKFKNFCDVPTSLENKFLIVTSQIKQDEQEEKNKKNSNSSLKLITSSESIKNKTSSNEKNTLSDDHLTDIVKKYRELQAKSQIYYITDDESDEAEDENKMNDLDESNIFETDSDKSASISFSTNSDLKKNENRLSKSDSDLNSSLLYNSQKNDKDKMPMIEDSIHHHHQNITKKNLNLINQTENSFKSIEICKKNYLILNLIGTGGSGKVYQIFDQNKNEFYALKIVELNKLENSLKECFKKEIEILKKLRDCKRVIQLYDYEYKDDKLLLVMEKGDSDLCNVLKKFVETETIKHLDRHAIKHYWKEMLKAVEEIHKNGIIHSDLKPVNFVTVKGNLKIIDFGIADSINPDHTSVLKDSLIGTINYMSPESLINDQKATKNGKKIFKINCKSDIWSLGCILYNMIYGKAPFGEINNMVQKINAICNPKHQISFPPYKDSLAIDCIKKCLQRDPKQRPTAADLLHHQYLNEDKFNSARLPLGKKISQTAFKEHNASATINKNINSLIDQVNLLTPRSLSRLQRCVQQKVNRTNK